MQNNCKWSKWEKYLCMLLCLPFFLLGGCQSAENSSSQERDDSSVSISSSESSDSSSEVVEVPKKETVNVSFVDSLFYTTEQNAVQVEKGKDFTATLEILNGYEFVSCDYGDYSVQEETDGRVSLTLHGVKRPSRISVTTQRKDVRVKPWEIRCSIEYNYNGVSYQGKESERVDYLLTCHLRPNTWNGVGLGREGYVLYGWNTQVDGSGDHIGLGSRVTVPEDGSITLYAEWAKAIEETQLSYEVLEDGTVALINYKGRNGAVEPFVIPEEVEGRVVTQINSSFTTNMRCGKLTSKTLILPARMQTIHMNAFGNSSFESIYFFDTLERVEDGAFPYNFTTYHLNAALPPHFVGMNNTTFFADNIDRLILHQNEKKILLFSGCSFAYGVDSARIEEYYEGEYIVYNLGVNGDINAAFQLDIILNYIQEGDIFIHAPEEMSQCQLMASYVVNDFMFMMVEGNYDLLAMSDFSKNDGVFYAFEKYKDIKLSLDPGDYSQGIYTNFSIHGDYAGEDRAYDEKNELSRDIAYSDGKYCFDSKLLTDNAMDVLCGYYDKIAQLGGTVKISYAPINENAQSGNIVREQGAIYAEKFEHALLERGYEVMSDYEDYIFKGRYFFDADYHMNDYGAYLRTEQLLADLEKSGI